MINEQTIDFLKSTLTTRRACHAMQSAKPYADSGIGVRASIKSSLSEMSLRFFPCYRVWQ